MDKMVKWTTQSWYHSGTVTVDLDYLDRSYGKNTDYITKSGVKKLFKMLSKYGCEYYKEDILDMLTNEPLRKLIEEVYDHE